MIAFRALAIATVLGYFVFPMASIANAQALGVAATKMVTPDTYIRAESDRNFNNIVAIAGGVNRFVHFRQPTPLDRQTIVRMNKDTLYSGAIIDVSKGASVTLPVASAGRFISALIVDNDHYAPAVFYGAGKHAIAADTKHVLLAIRIQVFDPADTQEVAAINALQDQIQIEAASADPLPPNDWNLESLEALTKQYQQEASKIGNYKGMMGPRGTVNEKIRHLAAAAGWGLNPEKDATYLNYSGQHDPQKCYTAVYTVPENNAFWSITVYGIDGYMKNNNNLINSSNVNLNTDGTFTAFFGSKELCGDVANRADVSPGWNFTMRIYRPGASVLNGEYKFSTPTPMK